MGKEWQTVYLMQRQMFILSRPWIDLNYHHLLSRNKTWAKLVSDSFSEVFTWITGKSKSIPPPPTVLYAAIKTNKQNEGTLILQ